MGSSPPQTTLELETQSSPPLRYNSPVSVSVPSFPAVVSASPSPRQSHLRLPVSVPPERPVQPVSAYVLLSREGLASMPLTFDVIREYCRRFRRFLSMEVVRAIIGLGVGALVTYFWMKKKN